MEELEAHVAITHCEEAKLHVHVDAGARAHEVGLFSIKSFELTIVATISFRMSSTVLTSV